LGVDKTEAGVDEAAGWAAVAPVEGWGGVAAKGRIHGANVGAGSARSAA
jgi:hypothetical protein